MDADVLADGHERGVRRVVDEDAAVERPRLRRGEQPLEVALGEAPPEPARDEDRLPLVRDSAPPQLRDRHRDRRLPSVLGRAGEGEGRRLDDDRRAPALRHERLERPAREREAERVAHRSRDVDDLPRLRGRKEDDVLVAGRNEDDPRAREERTLRTVPS